MKPFFLIIVMLAIIPLLSVYGESEIDIDLLVYKGNQYFSLGEYEQAISFYDKVLEENSNHIEATYYKGNALLKLGEPRNAIPYFEKTIYLNPNNFNAAIKLHDSLLKITSYKIGFLEGVLEIKVYDSDGNFISFLQTNKINAIKHNIVERLVDRWTISETIEKNNQSFHVRQQEFVKIVENDTILGFHQIPYSSKVNLPLTSTWHYQIPVEKGDTVSYTYSIFRPID